MITSSLKTLTLQLRTNWKAIIFMMATSGLPMGSIAIARVWKGIPISTLTRDTTAVGDLPAYAGFLSQLGIFIWVSTFSVLSFTLLLLSQYRIKLKTGSFLVGSLSITFILLIDDAFLLHESFLPGIGVPEKAVFSGYLCAIILYLFIFAKSILSTEFSYLVIALFFFGLSMLLDLLNPPGINTYFFEDGAKFIGIVSWMTYFGTVASSVVAKNVLTNNFQQNV